MTEYVDVLVIGAGPAGYVYHPIPELECRLTLFRKSHSRKLLQWLETERTRRRQEARSHQDRQSRRPQKYHHGDPGYIRHR